MITQQATVVPKRTKDITGMEFGRLKVLSFSEVIEESARWLCQCSCGKTVVTSGNSLRMGRTRSCGCLSRETLAAVNTIHGCSTVLIKTPEYTSWYAMKARCYYTRAIGYSDYGGRGISVCEKWVNDFAAFLADVGQKPSPIHTLDRYPDVNGNYEPGNVRWATPKQQQRNKRNNRMLTVRGETMCVSEWAERMGMRYDTIRDRKRRGWSDEDAVMKPLILVPRGK